MTYDQIFVIGMWILIVAGLSMLVQMFRVKWWWGVLGIFIPFSGLVFLFKHWNMAKIPFIINLIGLPFFITGLVFYPEKQIPLSNNHPLIITESHNWHAFTDKRSKPYNLNIVNKLEVDQSNHATIYLYTYLKSDLENKGITPDVEILSKSTYINFKQMYTEASIDSEGFEDIGTDRAYTIHFNGIADGKRVKCSALTMTYDKYIIASLLQSPEATYDKNERDYRVMLHSIKKEESESYITQQDK